MSVVTGATVSMGSSVGGAADEPDRGSSGPSTVRTWTTSLRASLSWRYSKAASVVAAAAVATGYRVVTSGSSVELQLFSAASTRFRSGLSSSRRRTLSATISASRS